MPRLPQPHVLVSCTSQRVSSGTTWSSLGSRRLSGSLHALQLIGIMQSPVWRLRHCPQCSHACESQSVPPNHSVLNLRCCDDGNDEDSCRTHSIAQCSLALIALTFGHHHLQLLHHHYISTTLSHLQYISSNGLRELVGASQTLRREVQVEGCGAANWLDA